MKGVPVPRPKTKEELVLASKENYEKLNLLISQLSEEELQTPFDFSKGPQETMYSDLSHEQVVQMFKTEAER